MKLRSIATMGLLGLGTLAFAQQPPAAPKPAPEMDQLKAFEGNWKCEGKQLATPMGPEHPIKYTWSAKRELDGFWLVGHLDGKKSKDDPMPIKGTYQFTYDAAGKKFVALWNDNMGMWLSQTSPGWQGDTMTLTGEMNMGGQKVTATDIFTKKGDKEMLHKATMAMGGKAMPFLEDSCKK